jgi:pimeloyl-ACP methyl ester carboxylesterase
MLFFGAIILSLIIIICLIPGYTKPIKDGKNKPIHGSIASLEEIEIGGGRQWILIRGIDITKPVILFLHGGPGTSDMCLLRRYMSELEKHFVVVSWDQRGAGKSFAAIHPIGSIRIDQFILDACELTRKLCQRFRKEKIFLAGHSWGSVLGIFTVKKQPGLYHAYIGIGQVANMKENENISYEWTLEQAIKARDRHTVQKLREMGPPPYSGKWQKKFMMQRRFLGKYGGEVYGNSKGAFPVVLGSLFRATEYSLPDKVNFFRGIFSTVRLLWPELMTVNLKEQATCLEVPVFFLLGRHDREAPSMIAEQYFALLQAPVKELIWFENSAHMPNIEENEKFISLLVNHISNVSDRLIKSPSYGSI